MKTQREVEQLKQSVQNKIDSMGERARACKFGSDEWEMYDREYAKLTAQYNILLEVLK